MEHCYLTINIIDGLFVWVTVALIIWILKLRNEIDEREQKISDLDQKISALEFKIRCEKARRKFKKLK